MKARARWIECSVVLALLIFTIWYIKSQGPWRSLPMEDALMLLRYSKHFAEGFGITWNIGEKPVEGATDFLFMITVGALSRITPFGPIAIDRMLLAGSHVASVAILYIGARRLFGWPIWASVSLAVYLAVDIARTYIVTGFGAPFFALAALLCWYVALRCVVSGPTVRRGAAIGALALITALIRPEGLFMGVFILAALVFALRRAALPALTAALAVLIPLGAIYFVWRWHYFGYPLPNPFYLKGDGRLYPESLSVSISAVCVMLAPAIPIFLIELFSRAWRHAVTALIPPIGFMCIWVLLSNENNHFMRFQYCAIPVALLSLPYASSRLRQLFSNARPLPVPAQVAAIAIIAALSQVYWDRLSPPIGSPVNADFGLYNIGVGLHRYKDKNYVLAVTEAGIVPYFSEWRSVDLYGLNDPYIVHSPQGLTQSYLEERNPAVILMHQPLPGTTNAAFAHSVSVTRAFVAAHNYKLAAAWAYSLCDRHMWYVRTDLPETQELVQLIRSSPYVISGNAMPDLRDTPIPAECTQQPVRLALSQ